MAYAKRPNGAVMTGLGPVIHPPRPSLDARVKPVHDGEGRKAPVSSSWVGRRPGAKLAIAQWKRSLGDQKSGAVFRSRSRTRRPGLGA